MVWSIQAILLSEYVYYHICFVLSLMLVTFDEIFLKNPQQLRFKQVGYRV